ncbi:Oidioi.mRNA.OKI2018_I69.chr1.g2208.t1.cds [Oikopleura dioica]|uniref:Oidioi.mRNA.OKI2018_I69.chr1.g2208.t1.cds n=1 Tax=Oikopleura dioica TaxID=34765 RepID=A0ABN7SS37_OIKDI|nr:Oidioi.mRNA.OKI2018_I69.chr1.g2208.t1.cds [Oikopleura dioica]
MRVLHLFVNQENEILAVVDGTNKSGYEIQAAARSENVPDRIFNYSKQDIPLSKSLKLNTKLLEEEINTLRREEQTGVNVELAKTFQMLIEHLICLRDFSWKMNFFEAGGTSIDAMILLNELRPPPEYHAQFLNSLKNENLSTVRRNLEKVDEVVRNSTQTSIKYSSIENFCADPSLSPYFFDDDKLPRSFKLDMRKFWAVDVGSCADCDPLLLSHEDGEEHLVIIGTHDGGLHAANARTGTLLWSQNFTSKAAGYLLWHSMLFVAESGKYLHLLDPRTGDVLLTEDNQGGARGPPMIYGESVLVYNENILLYDWDVSLCKLILKEKINIGETMMAKPLLTQNNDLIVATAKGKIIKISESRPVFQLRIGGPIFNTPVEENGELLVMNVKGLLTRINKEGTVKSATKITEKTVFAPIKHSLVANEKGEIFRIGFDS